MKTFTTLVEERRKVLGLTKPSAAVAYGKALGLNTNDQFWRNYRRERIGVPHWCAQNITKILWNTDAEMGRLVLATHRPSVVVHGTTAKIEQYARIMRGDVMNSVEVATMQYMDMFFMADEGDNVLAPAPASTGPKINFVTPDGHQIASALCLLPNRQHRFCDVVLTPNLEIYAGIKHGGIDDQREALLNAARGYVVRL